MHHLLREFTCYGCPDCNLGWYMYYCDNEYMCEECYQIIEYSAELEKEGDIEFMTTKFIDFLAKANKSKRLKYIQLYLRLHNCSDEIIYNKKNAYQECYALLDANLDKNRNYKNTKEQLDILFTKLLKGNPSI